MDMLKLIAEDAWRVLWVGLLLGAGLPVLFATGVRLLAGGEATEGPDGEVIAHRPAPWQKVAAWVCFAIVLYAVAVGLLVIIGAGRGEVVTFSHGIPHLVPKS